MEEFEHPDGSNTLAIRKVKRLKNGVKKVIFRRPALLEVKEDANDGAQLVVSPLVVMQNLKLHVVEASIESVLRGRVQVQLNRLEQLLLPVVQILDEFAVVHVDSVRGHAYRILNNGEVSVAVTV